MTADGRRAFIMNQGSNDVTVINSQTNQLDTASRATIHDPGAVAPIWADFAPTRNELVVANAGDGVNPGSVSIISIPLCSANAQPTNPNCDPNNPIDAVGFGTVLANVPVGINPRMVGVLQDGSRAYVVNEGNPNLPCAAPTRLQPLGNCTVSVINLTSNTVTATIPIPVSTSTGQPHAQRPPQLHRRHHGNAHRQGLRHLARVQLHDRHPHRHRRRPHHHSAPGQQASRFA